MKTTMDCDRPLSRCLVPPAFVPVVELLLISLPGLARFIQSISLSRWAGVGEGRQIKLMMI
jgi:hypothetical protein